MKRALLYLVGLIALITGCIKKNDLNFNNLQYTNWAPDWALPFVSTTLTLQNMLNTGTLVSADATGLLSLNYTAKGISFKASDFIQIPDQHFSTPSFMLSVPRTSLPAGQTVSDSTSGNFNYSDSAGSRLMHIGIKSGMFHINITSTFNQNVSLKITFPNIKNNGVALVLPVSILYPNTTADASADVTGYIIDLTNGHTTQNYMAYKMTYTLTGTGQPISDTSGLTAAVDFTGIQYSFIDGYLGHFVIPIPDDSINVGVLNKSITANIKLLNPKLHLSFTSSFGLSVALHLDSVYGYATATGRIDTTVIPAVIINGDSIIGQPAIVSSFIIDSTHSNLRNILSPVPNYIIYNGHISINPSTSTTYNFITDTSSITIGIDAELPACFKIIQLTLQDTVQMLMPPDTALLSSAQFKVQVTNAFPVYASVQLYFADSNFVILDSLINPVKPSNPNLVDQAPVDANGIVNGSTVKEKTFTMTQARYMKMASRIRHGIIRGNLYTSVHTGGTGFVQLFTSNHIDVKAAFRFTLNYSL